MQRLAIILAMLASGCASVNQIAICDGTRQERDALADALLLDGGDVSLVAGQALIAKIDAGCKSN